MDDYFEFERAVRSRADELLVGKPSEFNAAPTIDLVRRAFLAGYDLVPTPAKSVPKVSHAHTNPDPIDTNR